MLSRLLTLLAILAVSLVTTLATAHAARMSIGCASEHTIHAVEMKGSAVGADVGCDSAHPCGSADAAMCKSVCAGLLVIATPPREQVEHAPGADRHDVRPEAIPVGRVPEGTDRPPKSRLL